MRHLNVLIACEESQVEVEAFRKLGHNAFSCDLQSHRRGGNPAWHIKGDVSLLLQGRTQFRTMDGKHHHLSKWHLIIAHPPCTYLCKVSSVRLAANADIEVEFKGEKKRVNSERYANMLQGRDFFFQCYNANAPYVAVENPLPMAIANLPRPSCFADPSWYGSKYTKKTLYWTKNLPPLVAGATNPNTKCLVRSSRGKYRSRTDPGLAKAIAEQWGNYVSGQLGINK